FLPRQIGAARAADIIFTGRDIAADEALAIGLASRVFSADDFAQQALAYAESLANGPPVAFALTKRLLGQSADTSLASQLRHEIPHIKTCFATSDVAEAMTAFREKRAPVFTGT